MCVNFGGLIPGLFLEIGPRQRSVGFTSSSYGFTFVNFGSSRVVPTTGENNSLEQSISCILRLL